MSPKEERILIVSVIAIFLVYTVNSQLALFGGSIGFPQYDFSSLRRPVDVEPPHYLLRFIVINGEPLAEPVDFSQAAHWIEIEDRESQSAKDLINQLGSASFSDEHENISALRAKLEATYFDKIVSAEYHLILRNFTPVGHDKFRSSISEQVFGRYTYTRAQSH